MAKRKEPHTVFGKRLRHIREIRQMAQDRLGVAIGIDEGAASARMSRYESGTHEPPYNTAQLIAEALKVQVAYFYTDDDDLAELILCWKFLAPSERHCLLAIAQQKLTKSSS
jgi:transcriptional regulator with XRE-family HTH domain